jgi:hypothetical protein
VGFTPEFNLLVQCCRANFAAATEPLVRAPEALDWRRFVELARLHRVEGLASAALARSAAPTAALKELREDAKQIAVRNLIAAHESGALRELFAQAEIPILFMKGLVVGALAYRSASVKHAIDIDILVREHDVLRAAQLLAGRGYRVTIPADASASRLEHWHASRKESVWFSPAGIMVDLHSRASDNRRLLRGLGPRSPSQEVEVAGNVSLNTFAPDEMFAHLAVHGASSAWFRLKWISDFAGIVGPLPSEDIEALYRDSKSYSARRAAGQALLLADALFGSLDELPQLRVELARDRAINRLYRAALAQLLSHSEPTSSRLGTWAIHWSQFLLLPGFGFKASEFIRQARAMTD